MKLTFFDRKNLSSPWIKSNNIDKKGENGGGTFHCFNFPSQHTHFLTWWIWVVCLGSNCCCKNYDHLALQEFCTRSLGFTQTMEQSRVRGVSAVHNSLVCPFLSNWAPAIIYFLWSFSFGRKKGKIIYFLSFPLSHGRLAVQSTGEGSSEEIL